MPATEAEPRTRSTVVAGSAGNVWLPAAATARARSCTVSAAGTAPGTAAAPTNEAHDSRT